MASGVYARAKYLMATDQLGWGDPSAVFRGMLVTSGYVFNHVQSVVSDIAGAEVVGGTYARTTITGRTVGLDLSGNRALFDANNALFPELTVVEPSGLVIYKQTGGNDDTPGNDSLICYIDFPTTPATGLGFLVEFDIDGVFTLTAC